MSQPRRSPGHQQLIELQSRIHEYCREESAELDHENPAHPLWLADFNYLALAPMRAGLHVEYFGETWGEPVTWTLQCLARQDVADIVTSLAFTGPDEGANGTRDWDFGPLLEADVHFPVLRSLFVKPTEPADHNTSLIARTDLEEGGDIARFVAKIPYLTELTIPNAPDASFFARQLPHLSHLRISASYDTQNFIENLALSESLPKLRSLDFAESTELQFTWKAQRDPASITTFAAYERLLTSKQGQALQMLRLRNTCLSLGELEALQALHPKLQFMVIQSTRGGYVSHFRRDVFPWRHLVQTDPGEDSARYAVPKGS